MSQKKSDRRENEFAESPEENDKRTIQIYPQKSINQKKSVPNTFNMEEADKNTKTNNTTQEKKETNINSSESSEKGDNNPRTEPVHIFEPRNAEKISSKGKDFKKELSGHRKEEEKKVYEDGLNKKSMNVKMDSSIPLEHSQLEEEHSKTGIYQRAEKFLVFESEFPKLPLYLRRLMKSARLPEEDWDYFKESNSYIMRKYSENEQPISNHQKINIFRKFVQVEDQEIKKLLDNYPRWRSVKQVKVALFLLKKDLEGQ